jgi:hypothetical protein
MTALAIALGILGIACSIIEFAFVVAARHREAG